MDIDQAEQILMSSVASNTPAFHQAVEILICALLEEQDPSLGEHSTDGALLFHQDVAPNGAFGVGLLVWINGQLVDPVRVNFGIDPSQSRILTGRVLIGDSERPRMVYGSQEHKRTEKSLKSDHFREFPWKFDFIRHPDRWRCDRTPGVDA